MPPLEFFFDLGSPYSYLASTQVEAIAADCGAVVAFRPFALGAVFKATGNRAPAQVPAKAAYLVRDLARWARYFGVPFEAPLRFPMNTLNAQRVLHATAAGPKRTALTHRLFAALWVEGADLERLDVLEAMAGAECVQAATSPQGKGALRDTTDEAIRRGAFGAPTFFVGDKMYWGCDRLPFVERALRSAK